MIFTLVSSTKAEGWTNAGEFSYLFPNGTKQITDYTLTEDGKSIVVITLDSSYKEKSYYRYKLQRINFETGISDFDTLWITNKYSYQLSRDGLTAFEIYQYYRSYNCHIEYNLFDIFHSSKGYLYKEVLYDNYGNPYNELNQNLNSIDFISKDNSLLYGTTIHATNSFHPDHSNASSCTSGTFKIFDIYNKNNYYKNDNGATYIYDYHNGKNNLVFYHYSNSYSDNSVSSSQSSVVLVDSSKKATQLLLTDKIDKTPKILKLIGDSLLIIHKEVNKHNNIYYYDRKKNEFRNTFKFPFVNNNALFKIGLSNDGNYLAKSDGNIIQFYKSSFNYPILEIQIPDSLSTYTHYSFSYDDKYILTVNNKNQFIRFENPIKSNNFRALFSISDSILLAGRTYKTVNCSTGNPNAYSWDFGNSKTSTEFHPEFKFDVTGNYTITFTAEKDAQYSTQEKVVTVLNDYKVDFEIVTIPEYSPIVCKFKNTSSENIDSLIWDFGDGTYSKSKDIEITHLYSKEAEYSVKLKVFYNKFADSIEKNVIIKSIKEPPLTLDDCSEYNFENTTNYHQKINTIYEAGKNEFILVNIEHNNTTLYKTLDDFHPYITVSLNITQNFKSTNPENLNEVYFDNTLKYNDNTFFVCNSNKLKIYDSKLNTLNSNYLPPGWFHKMAFPNNIPNQNLLILTSDPNYVYLKKLNAFTGRLDSAYSKKFYYILNDYPTVKRYYSYFLAFTPINNNFSHFSRYYIHIPERPNDDGATFFDQSVKLIKKIPFSVFRNIDTTTFVGLDTLGNIYKFNANGDSLNKIALTPGLRNIAVNGSLYYAVGFKDNHPICYAFDNDLNMKDTIYIEQRDGAFLDALVCKSGDLVLAGYKYIPSKTDTAGKLLRSSYILKINKYSDAEDTTKSIPISITNPIDHLATIRIKADTSTIFRYEIFNLSSNLVFETAEQKIDSDYTGQVDFSGLAPGVYIFKFYINGKIVTKKVIYQK
jgi:PKD repeat protein